jgi:hypothetical protein
MQIKKIILFLGITSFSLFLVSIVPTVNAQILPLVVTANPEYYETDGFGLTVLKHYGFPTTPYDYLNVNLPVNLPVLTPVAQLSMGISPFDVVCKEGLELVVKPSKESVGCVKTTSVVKLIERNWIHVFEPAVALATGEADLETEESTPDTIHKQSYPPDVQRAMSFAVTFSGGRLTPDQSEPIYTFSKFKHLSKVTDDTIVLPQKIAANNPQFILESLPSLDKKPFYKLVNDWIKENPFAVPFDVKVDVVAGNGEVIQSWAYTECNLVDYHTFLLENLIVYKFHEKFESEIRDRVSFSCGDFELQT